MKTRTLLKDGEAVTVSIHKNDGLRKRCDCARRSWPTCSHPWFFSFKIKGGESHRFVLHKYADHRITTKAEALLERDRLRTLIRNGNFPPPALATTPVPVLTPAALTFGVFSEKWRTTARATVSDSQQTNDKAHTAILGRLLVGWSPPL